MTSLAVQVRIVDGVATTRLEQVLKNSSGSIQEAIWLLPLPEGAVADGFRMTVNGVEMAGEVLGADQARGIYEDIVRRKRDPGLLEYFGRGCLRARIFPIPAHGQVKVDVVFRQIVPQLGGLHRWSLALNAAGLEGRPPEHVTLDLSISSKKPLRNVFSPAKGIEVVRKDDHEARASFEGEFGQLSEGELAVFYGLSEQEFGLNLLSTRKKGTEEGSFLMLVAPKREWDESQVMRKSITFVLDTSGSMSGRKIDQARGALRSFLGSLRPDDRFNIIPFATEALPFFPEPVSATPENLEAAYGRIDGIEARGGTNISQALALALGGATCGEHVPIVVFLTDGLPTVGEKDAPVILSDAERWNTAKARIFVFGVGHDVDTNLLDNLAGKSGGARDYVREKESIEEKAGDLFTKLSHPVMTDLELSVDGVEVSRRVPAKLPDLFKGATLQVFGRYQGKGAHAIRLTGTVQGVRREYVYEGTFAEGPVEDHDFVPPLWAERRVGVLLDAIRLNGSDPELVGEVKRLGREYQIVTPYTSHLIVEEGLAIALPTGPATPGTGGVTSGADGWFLGQGGTGPSSPGSLGGARAGLRRNEEVSLDEITLRLRDAGVLPDNAPAPELESLALEVVRELRASQEGFGRLGYAESGKDAVDDSVYLAHLIAGRSSGSDNYYLGHGDRGKKRADLVSLFTRRVKDKVFVLRKGVWTDRTYDVGKMAAGKKVVEAWSREYFDLLKAKPELRSYFAFSTRLIVVIGSEVYEVRAPAN
ncbi:MAG: VIT domain-containing protein [Planctomycetota bacterium]|nr:VIT domain-containing protein [Planctomycetota bacterium]